MLYAEVGSIIGIFLLFSQTYFTEKNQAWKSVLWSLCVITNYW